MSFAYVGSITRDPGANAGQGISVIQVEPESGAMTCIQHVTDLQSPTYLAIHPRLDVLYAGERDWPAMGLQSPGTGAITTFAIDPNTGQLTFVARQKGGGPAHV